MTESSPSKVVDEIDSSNDEVRTTFHTASLILILFQHVNLLKKLWRKPFLDPVGNLNPFIGTAGGKPIQMEVSTTIWYLNEVILKGGFIAKMKYITNVKENEQENYNSAFCYFSKYDTEIYLNLGHPKKINTKHCHLTLSIVIKCMQEEDQKPPILQKLVIPSQNFYLT